MKYANAKHCILTCVPGIASPVSHTFSVTSVLCII